MDTLKATSKTTDQKKIKELVTRANLMSDDSGNIYGTRMGNDANCGQILCKEVSISAADIVSTSAGKFGHAAGYPLVADPGADYLVEHISTVLIYDYATAAYTAGGNITVNENGGSALTGLISAANSVGAAADKIATFVNLATAAVNRTANKGLNLVSSVAFTQPGSAAGVIRVQVQYRLHKLGLA